MLDIRPATENDIEAITDIYNQSILRTTATFDTVIKTNNDMLRWFRSHGSTHPVIVAVDKAMVVGWASLSKWSERAAYDSTVELSVYVDEGKRGRGVGKSLMEKITEEGKQKGFHAIISRITKDNEISIKLHNDTGYKYTGALIEVGKKFGIYLDVLFYQIIFKENE